MRGCGVVRLFMSIPRHVCSLVDSGVSFFLFGSLFFPFLYRGAVVLGCFGGMCSWCTNKYVCRCVYVHMNET